MRKWLLRILYAAMVMLPVGAIANYAMTVGSGTNFGSVVIGGVHFASSLICDFTTANQCTSVSASNALKVDASATTQPVSQATAASLNATVVGTGTFATQLTGATNNINNIAGTVSLPTGASTAAKQPALGTAGTPSADVISVQGEASMTPLVASPAATLTTLTGWTTATAGNTTQTLFSTGGWAAVLLQLDQTSTLTVGAITIEGTYDGTNWVTVPVAQVLNPNTLASLTNPYTLVASTNQPFLILTQGYQSVRIRLSTTITGTATVTPFVALLPYNPVIGALLNPLAAGSAIIGKVGIDQTTPGTTNLVALGANQSVNVAQFGGVSTSTGQVAVSVAPVTATNTALVVDLRPDSPGIIALGTNTAANSVPVVLNTTPTIANGNGVLIAPTAGATASPTVVACGSAVSSCVLKNAAGNLYDVYAECTSACWLMVFASASAPANGATTAGVATTNMQHCVAISAGGTGSIVNGSIPEAFVTGITAVVSSTACASLTLSTVGFIHGRVQ